MCFSSRKCGLRVVTWKLGKVEFGQEFFYNYKEFCKGRKVVTVCYFIVLISCTAVLLATKINAACSDYFPQERRMFPDGTVEK
jgi:hypothetical protein